MTCSTLLVAALALGAAGAPASSLRGSSQPAEGRCCFNGCGDENSCVTDYCTTREQCLSPQPDGGCDSSPPFGQGAKPSWCPASLLQTAAAGAETAGPRPGTKANLTDDYCHMRAITAELWTQVCKHQVCHNDIAESDPGNDDHGGDCWHCWCNGVGDQEGRQPIGDDYKDKVFNEFQCCPVNDGTPDPCGGWKLQEPSWTVPQCP